ncbi:GerAB/ArcD/ProY family transporter [Paenibacillus sedimenti]|uniref:Endospore germination permease n=1 Tax=Paenibacillus sedimenti TaxID=2770274 RepID=A0A926QK08_9BACL|nr:endospore germination permease [Paenibacillus sedimenti]MBD0382301.1 endospore germination permease [Paenibacillus sedimenti]
MQSQEKINNRQLAVLVTLYTIGDSILVLPSIPAMIAKEDAWISGLVGLLIGLLFAMMFAWLGKLNPGLNVYEYSRNLLGKWGGQYVALLLTFYFLLMVSAQIREMGDFMTIHIMPETPIHSIILLFLGVVILGARIGIETIARLGELLFPHFLLLYCILVLCLLPEIDLKNLAPVLHTGWKPIIYSSFTTITFPFAEIVCFLVILPSVNNAKRIPKSMLAGTLIGGIILEIVIVLTIAVLGAPITANQIYPTYSLTKKISIGNFLERIEAMLAIMWIITTYFKTVLNYYALMHGIANLTKLSDPKLATLPLGMILIVSSLVSFPDIAYFNDLVANYWPYLDFTICLALPLLLLGLHFTAKKS